ncbi:MAG: hypothetical protein LW715_02155 [Rhodobacter sp.]|jgi:hypothetical protein|nr:hypothetical protein [Rhodobacter sp.]
MDEFAAFLTVLAPFSSLLTALVASGTAVWIAVWAYPKQKLKDREIQIHGEKRVLYRSFLAEFEQAIMVPVKESDDWKLNPSIRKLAGLSSEIRLVGGKEVRNCCDETLSAIYDLHMADEFRKGSHSAGDGKMRTYRENAFYQRTRVLEAMQKELGQL